MTFEFPFFYNYSTAFTCEGDSVPYYKLLQRVAAKCPKLREVKVNMEMFVERLNNGLHVRSQSLGRACYVFLCLNQADVKPLLRLNQSSCLLLVYVIIDWIG